MQFVGLADTRRIRRCERFRSGAEAVRWLSKRVACTAADDFGALNVWNDKFGKYRCEAMRWCRTVDSRTFTSLREVQRWCVEWLVRIGARPPAAKE